MSADFVVWMSDALFPTHYHPGIFLSNACFVAGLVVLHGWAREKLGALAARRAVLLALLAPATVFFSA